MVSIHDQPPFSVADRLPDPQILYNTATPGPWEVRLLGHRSRRGTQQPRLFFRPDLDPVTLMPRSTVYTQPVFIFGASPSGRKLYERLGFSAARFPRSARARRRFRAHDANSRSGCPKKLEHMKKMWGKSVWPRLALKTKSDPVCPLCPGRSPIVPASPAKAFRRGADLPTRGPEIHRPASSRCGNLLGDMVGGRDVGHPQWQRHASPTKPSIGDPLAGGAGSAPPRAQGQGPGA